MLLMMCKIDKYRYMKRCTFWLQVYVSVKGKNNMTGFDLNGCFHGKKEIIFILN